MFNAILNLRNGLWAKHRHATVSGAWRAVVLSLFLMPSLAMGQYEFETEGSGLQAGPFRVLASLGLTWGHNDNLSRTENLELESYFYIVSPGIRVELPGETTLLSLTWEYDLGRYDYKVFEFSGLDDYDDRNITLDFSWNPTARHLIEAFASDVEGHDGRGEGSRQGPGGLVPIPVDTWERRSLGGAWTYGAVGAKGELSLEAGVSDLDYTNNPEFTEFRDYESDYLNAHFGWRVAPKTLLGFGVDTSRYEYDASDPFSERGSLDSDQLAWFVTVDWDLAAKTTGSVRFGRQKKSFDSPVRGDYDNNYWAADIEWRPRTYSILTLSTANTAQETDGFGDYIQRRSYSADWQHHWRERFSTTLQGGVAVEDHEPGLREDDVTWWGVSGRWQVNKNLQVGAGWTYYDRSSSLNFFGYEQNVWQLTLEGSL